VAASTSSAAPFLSHFGQGFFGLPAGIPEFLKVALILSDLQQSGLGLPLAGELAADRVGQGPRSAQGLEMARCGHKSHGSGRGILLQ